MGARHHQYARERHVVLMRCGIYTIIPCHCNDIEHPVIPVSGTVLVSFFAKPLKKRCGDREARTLDLLLMRQTL